MPDFPTFQTLEERDFWMKVYLAALPQESDQEGSAAWAQADLALEHLRDRNEKFNVR
jgi:hypothetical protein